MEKKLFTRQKQRLAKRVEPFPIKNGVMYRMGQDNRLKQCLLTTRENIYGLELMKSNFNSPLE